MTSEVFSWRGSDWGLRIKAVSSGTINSEGVASSGASRTNALNLIAVSKQAILPCPYPTTMDVVYTDLKLL